LGKTCTSLIVTVMASGAINDRRNLFQCKCPDIQPNP